MTWFSVNEHGAWCSACGEILARQDQAADFDGEECPTCGFPENAEKMEQHFCDDDGDDGDCWQCGGEGFTYDCFDGFCEDAESGCDDCARRCDVCQKRPAPPELQEVLAEALAKTK